MASMKCRVCSSDADSVFTQLVLKKYNVEYFKCNNCGFLMTEEPYWLSEAYSRTININDTGYMQRNLFLRDFLSVFLMFFLKKDAKFLDYGGGYGVFVRLMRDVGFDFYWDDKFTKNLFSEGFQLPIGERVELVTSFECFEHFDNPALEVEKMAEISSNILFTTELIPNEVPERSWWYYGFNEGQHISFFTKKTLNELARKKSMRCYSYRNIHFFTKKENFSEFKLILTYWLCRFQFFLLIKKMKKSKTWDDYIYLSNK